MGIKQEKNNSDIIKYILTILGGILIVMLSMDIIIYQTNSILTQRIELLENRSEITNEQILQNTLTINRLEQNNILMDPLDVTHETYDNRLQGESTTWE